MSRIKFITNRLGLTCFRISALIFGILLACGLIGVLVLPPMFIPFPYWIPIEILIIGSAFYLIGILMTCIE